MATHAQPNLEQSEEEPREEVYSFVEETSGDVKKALKKASGRGESVTVAGVEGIDPEAALKNLEVALKYVKKMVHFSEGDLYFTKFGGQTVGEHRGGKKVAVDAIMLMHPAQRLAHVIVHEYCHGNDVENEGLVEARTKALLDKSGLLIEGDGVETTEKYDVALANFYEFARRVGEGRDMAEVIEEIYNLYYSGNYESIYEMYEKKYMDGLKSDEERIKALEDFEAVFPELSVQKDGWFEPKEIPL